MGTRAGRCATTRAAALALLAFLAAAPAGAYQIDRDRNGHALHWSHMPVRWQMVAGNAPEGAAGEAAVKRAFGSWSDASDAVEYAFDGFSSGGGARYDRRNLVHWVYEDWPYDANLVAVTTRYYSNADGELLDADVVFNGERHTWSTVGIGYDVENAAAHEAGHFGGLGHSGESRATMYASASPGETQKRSLENDDVVGLQSIYGGTTSGGGRETNPGGVASSPAQAAGPGGGGCSIGTRPRAAAGELVWLVLLLAAHGWRRCNRRFPSGTGGRPRVAART